MIPHCKLQRGSRNLSFDFFDISVHVLSSKEFRECLFKASNLAGKIKIILLIGILYDPFSPN